MSERVRRHLAGEPTDSERLCNCHLGPGFPDCPTHGSDKRFPVRVGSEREGWRARLANVERLVSEAWEQEWGDGGRPGDQEGPGEKLRSALAEVRSMIDGDETTGAP